jgi:predicted DsbA family dithiol-disulfide isomerase
MDHNDESQRAPVLSAARAGVRSPIIDVVFDIVCPWCFIGKRRMEKALAILDRQDVPIRWKPFQLNPTAPKEGMDRQEACSPNKANHSKPSRS